MAQGYTVRDLQLSKKMPEQTPGSVSLFEVLDGLHMSEKDFGTGGKKVATPLIREVSQGYVE